MSMTITFRPGGTGLCPLCREAISRQALKCPHCHSDLSQNQEWIAAAKIKAGYKPWVVLVLVLLAIGFQVYYQNTHKSRLDEWMNSKRSPVMR